MKKKKLILRDRTLLALSLGLLFSALNVKYRDIGTVLPVLLQLWLFVSPVIYPASLVPPAWKWLEQGGGARPFFAAIALFLLGYLGLAISTFPYLVPPTLTIWDTAAAPASQTFMLIGTLILLPIILFYTGFIYWIFRGKVREGEGYH